MFKFKFLVGIDEAGRGPLAGPVSVGVVIMNKKFDTKLLKGIKDSKKLTSELREVWFEKLHAWKKDRKLDYAVALVSAKIIDEKGISFAIRSGIKICLKKVKADCTKCLVLLDGSLKAPEEFKKQRTIIKGDEKEPIISLASIAAKVTRDAHMVKMARKYSHYLFDVHKGYGTKKHLKLIKMHGPSKIHRLSFLKNG